MNFEPLLQELASLLEIDASTLAPETELARYANWDSLAKVSLLAFVHERYARTLDATRLDDRAATVADLLAAVAGQETRAVS